MSPRAAWRLERLGFTDVYDYVAGKADWFAAGLPREGDNASTPRIADLADPDVPVCSPDDTVGAAAAAAGAGDWGLCVVVTDGRVVLGLLRGDDLGGDPGRRAEEAMREGPSTFRPDVPVEEMAGYLREHPKLGQVLVTTPDGRLLGAVRPADVARRG